MYFKHTLKYIFNLTLKYSHHTLSLKAYSTQAPNNPLSEDKHLTATSINSISKIRKLLALIGAYGRIRAS